jgi:uncharacterized protein
MIIPDTNLLVYAYDRGSSNHSPARAWWESSLSGSEPVGIPWIVALAFVRLMTHSTLSENPMSVIQASSILQEWLEIPVCRLLPTTEKTFAHFLHLISDEDIGGNLTTDALIASSAVEFGGTIYSNDRDFDRFQFIRRINPLR